MSSTDEHNEHVGQVQDFPRLIRHYRLAVGWTQEQLAERAGVSRRSISNLERGSKHIPRGDTIRMIAAALDLNGEGAKAFMVAARVRDDAQEVALSHELLATSAGSLVEGAAFMAGTRDAGQEIKAMYEFLRRVGGLLREIG